MEKKNKKTKITSILVIAVVAVAALVMSFSDGSAQGPGGALSCSETDGGDDPFALGTTSDSTGSYTDECTSGEHLTEWYCDGNSATSRALSCTGATGGVGCVDGACIRCGDTDGGDEPFVAGTTFVQGQSESDYCISGEHLQEYYCDEDGNIASRALSCTGQTGGSGCSEGACYN